MKQSVKIITILMAMAFALVSPVSLRANDYGCSRNNSMVVYNNCISDVSERLEDELVLAYKIAAVSTKHQDKKFGFGSLASALQASEISWEKYRKAQCEMEFVSTRGGNAAGTYFLYCSIEMTLQRIKYLKTLAR